MVEKCLEDKISTIEKKKDDIHINKDDKIETLEKRMYVLEQCEEKVTCTPALQVGKII